MPSFTKDAYRTPFGVNVFLRSTQDVKTESATAAASMVPSVTIDGFAGQKILQKGVLMARATSGADSGKVGPYQPGTGNEVQTITITGTPTGGTFSLDFEGEVTAPIAYNATAADVKAALELLTNIDSGAITAGGGAFPGSAVTVSFGGNYAGTNVSLLEVVDSRFTGGSSPAAAVAQTTAADGTAGATDGRQLVDNIVGFNNTFLPWQLTNHDEPVAIVYEASVVLANCLMQNPDGTYRALDAATAEALKELRNCSFTFH